MPPTGNEIQLRQLRKETEMLYFISWSSLILQTKTGKMEDCTPSVLCSMRWKKRFYVKDEGPPNTHFCKWPSFVSVYINIVEVTDPYWTMPGSNIWLPSLPVSQPHINTYQFDIKLSVQRCLTDPLLSPDTASDCNCRRETHTEKAFIYGSWLHGCNTQHIIQIICWTCIWNTATVASLETSLLCNDKKIKTLFIW